MEKQDILKLINKGLVTACGLLDSERIQSMEKKEFYDLYVCQTGTYTESPEPEPVEAPTFEPANGEVADGTRITLNCTTPEAEIYFSYNTFEPGTDVGSLTKYEATSSQPTITGSQLSVYAMAVKGSAKSEVVNTTYSIQPEEPETVENPTFEPASGTSISGATQITLACATPDAEIYFSYDTFDQGADVSGLTKYETSTGQPSVSEGQLSVYAIAVKGDVKSEVVSATYTYQAAGDEPMVDE